MVHSDRTKTKNKNFMRVILVGDIKRLEFLSIKGQKQKTNILRYFGWSYIIHPEFINDKTSNSM